MNQTDYAEGVQNREFGPVLKKIKASDVRKPLKSKMF